MSVSDDVKQLEDDLAAMTEERDELQLELDGNFPLDHAMVTRIEEHVIKLQDEDVNQSTRVHEETIALLREIKA